MDSPAPSTPEPTPCTCRACGQVMVAKSQKGSAHVADHFIVTCVNPACWMHEYTFADTFYPSVDLAQYRAAV